jgi:hypothetical protein
MAMTEWNSLSDQPVFEFDRASCKLHDDIAAGIAKCAAAEAGDVLAEGGWGLTPDRLPFHFRTSDSTGQSTSPHGLVE